MTQTIQIDGKSYSLDSLSSAARQQLVNIQSTDLEINRQAALLNMLQSARAAYVQVLKAELGTDVAQ